MLEITILLFWPKMVFYLWLHNQKKISQLASSLIFLLRSNLIFPRYSLHISILQQPIDTDLCCIVPVPIYWIYSGLLCHDFGCLERENRFLLQDVFICMAYIALMTPQFNKTSLTVGGVCKKAGLETTNRPSIFSTPLIWFNRFYIQLEYEYAA